MPSCPASTSISSRDPLSRESPSSPALRTTSSATASATCPGINGRIAIHSRRRRASAGPTSRPASPSRCSPRLLGLAAFACLVGLGLGWLLFRPQARRAFCEAAVLMPRSSQFNDHPLAVALAIGVVTGCWMFRRRTAPAPSNRRIRPRHDLRHHHHRPHRRCSCAALLIMASASSPRRKPPRVERRADEGDSPYVASRERPYMK